MLINLITKNFNNIKFRNFGVGKKICCCSIQKFGLPKLDNNVLSKYPLFKVCFDFNVFKATRNLNNFILSNPLGFNLVLRRLINKRVRMLKFNRSLRGLKHSLNLPVRGQRTKTNANTQKRKRK